MPSEALAFLIDECLHSSLVQVASVMGYAAHHVKHLGLKGSPDWLLWKRALQDDLIFVSNNAHDFRTLSSKSAIHPGVVLILPMARPEIQRRSFRVGLDYLSGRTNLINRLIEIDLCEDRAEIREFEMP